MNIDELYEFIGQRISHTGTKGFHISLTDDKTEFTQEEAEEIANCVLSLCEAKKTK